MTLERNLDLTYTVRCNSTACEATITVCAPWMRGASEAVAQGWKVDAKNRSFASVDICPRCDTTSSHERRDGTESPYGSASEEAHYTPGARALWSHAMKNCERRGLPYDAEALAEAALALHYERDPIDRPIYRCIRARHGLPCDGDCRGAGRGCDFDIPF